MSRLYVFLAVLLFAASSCFARDPLSSIVVPPRKLASCSWLFPDQSPCTQHCDCACRTCNNGWCMPDILVPVPVPIFRPTPVPIPVPVGPVCGTMWPVGQRCLSDCQCACGSCINGCCQSTPEIPIPLPVPINPWPQPLPIPPTPLPVLPPSCGARWPDFYVCSSDCECSCGSCYLGFCRRPPPPTQRCGVNFPVQSPCSADCECGCGSCWQGRCQVRPQPGPNCGANFPVWYRCTSDCECACGSCINGICTQQQPNNPWLPTPEMPTCGANWPVGYQCSSHCQCSTGWCSGGSCCWQQPTPLPQPIPLPTPLPLPPQPRCGSFFPDLNPCSHHCECSCGSCFLGYCRLQPVFPQPIQPLPTPIPQWPQPIQPLPTPIWPQWPVPNPLPQPLPYPLPPQPTCGSRLPLQSACSYDCECSCGSCWNRKCFNPPQQSFCTSANTCPWDQYCQYRSFSTQGACVPRKPVGAGCGADWECLSGRCGPNNVCCYY